MSGVGDYPEIIWRQAVYRTATVPGICAKKGDRGRQATRPHRGGGGGLIRSVGGWSAAKALRTAGAFQKGDERILGDGEFVEQVLAQAKETFERKYRLKMRGGSVERIAERVAEILDIDVAQL